jgi:RNA polymerase sigma factor (sigma-70 family)
VDETELTQEGVVGVLRALDRYDPARGDSFWAYASWWVRQAMQQLVSELTGPVVLSDRAVRQLARLKHARRDYLQVHREEPTPRQLAAETGLRWEQVENLIAVERRPRALEEPVGDDADPTLTYQDLVADPRAGDEYDQVSIALRVEDLSNLLDELSERERIVVCARYGVNGPEKTLRELGGELGVSAERVRQIAEEGLSKLREAADRSKPRRIQLREGPARGAARSPGTGRSSTNTSTAMSGST